MSALPLRRLLDDQAAATSIEYALIATLIGLMLVVALTSMGQTLSTFFTNVATNL